MGFYGLFWILVFYGFVWKKNQTINLFLMSLDLKEPYLVYWLCFGLELVYYNP